jgi:hypothetical protein
MAALATTADVAARLGRTLTAGEETRLAAILDDVSATIRAYCGVPFASTVAIERLRPKDGRVLLSRRPSAITAVETIDGDAISYTWSGGRDVTVGTDLSRFDLEPLASPLVDVTYTHGSNTVPAAVVAVACQMAARSFGRPADSTGVVQESIAGYSYSVGAAAAAGPAGMLADERTILDRYRPVGASAWVRI